MSLTVNANAEPNLAHKNNFITAIAELTFSFLRPNELALDARVCRYWQEIISSDRTWQVQCEVQGFPKKLPAGISCRQVIKDFYPSMFGKDFYTDYIGDVTAIPAIPENFIARAYLPDPFEAGKLVKDNFVLVLDPGFIALEILSNKFLEVPTTIKNIGVIAEKCIKRGHTTGFDENSWRNIFLQHGDTRSPSAWSYQRKVVIGSSANYAAQCELAAKNGFKVESLKTRVLFSILSQIRIGKDPDTHYVARTSTVTLVSATPHLQVQSAVTWTGSCITARVCLVGDPFDASHVGAAVGVKQIA